MPDVPLHAVVLDGARDVLCELRGNRRFGYLPALSFVAPSTPAEHPLVADVKRLRNVVRAARAGPAPLPPDALAAALDPFLRIAASRDTSANISGAALRALDRVAAALLALPAQVLPGYAPVLAAIVGAAAGCRFDASDPARDEVVLSRIAGVVARVAGDARAVVLLSDAALLQGVAACLDIALGRRRTSDLLKRCADAALVDIAAAMAACVPASAASAAAAATCGVDAAVEVGASAAVGDGIGGDGLAALLQFDVAPHASASSRAIDAYLGGGSFGLPFDLDAHAAHGPASPAAVAAVLELACKMADPALPGAAPARTLGLQLVSAVLTAGGAALREHAPLRRLLTRECSRSILRAVGSFSEPPAFISAAFSTATHLVYALGSDGTAFLTALLQKVFPYYISGYEGVLPRLVTLDDFASYMQEGSTLGAAFGGGGGELGAAPDALADGGGGSGVDGGDDGMSLPRAAAGVSTGGTGTGGSGSDGERDLDGAAGATEIDPVVREVGLEALSSLVATQGLLAAVYQVTDCSLGCGDVVTALLLALGGAINSRAFRRRSKRLRPSTGGSLSPVAVGPDADSDDDDEGDRAGMSPAAIERSRRARATALLCADSLMALVDIISERMKTRSAERNNNVLPTAAAAVDDGGQMGAESGSSDYVAELRAMHLKKRRLKVTAEAFNDPSFVAKNGAKVLQMLRQHGQVPDAAMLSNVEEDRAADVAAVVRFLRDSPGLNKEKIGAVLGEPDAFSQAVLASYTGTFGFADRPFTECLRIFLESFRLPGESQKIDRIVECFAERYESQNRPEPGMSVSLLGMDSPSAVDVVDGALTDEALAAGAVPGYGRRYSTRGVFANADAVFTLSFAVVMLNTDQHNPSIRKKMTVEDFVKNTRGINDKRDLPRWFLAEVFDSIAAVEIRMSDEAGMRALTDLHWDEQLRDMVVNKRVMPSLYYVSPFDEDVFNVCWGSCISGAMLVFHEAVDAGVSQKALEGLLNVAKCGSACRRCEPTDAAISVLADATSVREGPLFGATIRFGTNMKAQMAAVALSGVARQCGDWMRAPGWASLVAYVLRLHALGLLPDTMEESLGGCGEDLIFPDGSALPDSTLTPTWWPSQQLKMAERERAAAELSRASKSPPKKQKMNGFFALIAASISGDSHSDDEYDSEDDVYHDVPPAYLKLRSAEDAEAEELAKKSVSNCRFDEILINEAKVLRSDALSCLANGLADAANEVLDGDMQENGLGASLRVNSGRMLHGPPDGEAETVEFQVRGGGTGNGESNTPENETGKVNGSVKSGTDVDRPLRAGRNRESSIIAGTARIIRNSGTSIQSGMDLNGFGGTSQWMGALRERDEAKARASVVAFCIDVLCQLTLQNRDRLSIPWPALHGILLRVIDRNTRSMALLERAIVALLRVADRLLHRSEIQMDVLRGLNLIVNLPAKTVEELSLPVSAGVYNMVKTHGLHVSSVSGWHALLSIIENGARFPEMSRDISFQSLSFLLTDDPSFEAVSAETYAPLLEAVLAYTACPSVEVSMNALDLLSSLSERIPKLAQNVSKFHNHGTSQVGVDRPWTEYWGPLLRGLATASRDSRGKVRNTALVVLESVVAKDGAASHLTAAQWHMTLSSVLLPLMEDLFSSMGFLRATIDAERAAQKTLIAQRNAEAAAAAPRGRNSRNAVATPAHDAQLVKMVKSACDKTRLRAVMLMAKTFLQYHMRMAEGLGESVFTELWLGVLHAFKSALSDGRTGNDVEDGAINGELREHVPESLKNILLVLCASGLLDRTETSERWKATFALLNDCLPQLELEEFVIRASSPPSPAPAVRSSSSFDDANREPGTQPVATIEVGDLCTEPQGKPVVPARLEISVATVVAEIDGDEVEQSQETPIASAVALAASEMA